MTSRRHAFTLIELLVVISIIALLVSILLPALQSARGSAMSITCQSMLRTVGQASHMYAADWEGFFPASKMYGAPKHSDGGYDNFWPRRDLEPYLGVHARTLDYPDHPLMCPTYRGQARNKIGGNYAFTYTYNQHYGDQNANGTWAHPYNRPDQLATGGHGWAAGPSGTAYIVDGTRDGTTDSGTGLIPVAYQERESFMLYGSDGGKKGILNLHVGFSNNWGFFDGHVANLAGSATATSTEIGKLWYPIW